MTSPGLAEAQVIAVRAVVFEPRELGVYEAEASSSGSLDAWLRGGTAREGPRVRLHVLQVERLGLLVQRLPSNKPFLAWWPLLEAVPLGWRLCRFHWGEWGKPLEHRYCTRRAETPQGFCRLHASSWMALYELCARGVDSACVEAARLLQGRSFAVYVLDYGGRRLKAGLTQEWRLLWRLAEQPHLAAAAVYKGGLLEARAEERRLGRLPGASEGPGSRVSERLGEAAAAVERLARDPAWAAERLAQGLARLGLRGSYEAYAVLPRDGVPRWVLEEPKWGPAEALARGPLRLLDYWAGLLLVEAGGERGVLDKRELQHLALSGRVDAGRQPL